MYMIRSIGNFISASKPSKLRHTFFIRFMSKNFFVGRISIDDTLLSKNNKFNVSFKLSKTSFRLRHLFLILQ